MAIHLKFIRFLLLLLLPLFVMQGASNFAWAQEVASESVRRPQVSSIRIGPHPVYTRILVNLTESVSYQVKADFVNKRITLILPYTARGPRLRSRSFNDKNLERYLVTPLREDLEVTFVLKNQNTRFFHSTNPQKPQIILDIKGESRPILRTRIGKLQRKPGGEQAPLPEKARLVGL